MAAKGVSLAQTDFPLYAIRVVGDRHFLVAGGGGSAKTGILNAVVSYLCNRTLISLGDVFQQAAGHSVCFYLLLTKI